MEELKHTEYLPTQAFERLCHFDWFCRCGTRDPSFHDCIWIEDESVALQMLESVDYEDFQIERQGDMTVHLMLHHRNEGNEWNAHNLFIKQQLSGVFDTMRNSARRRGFPKVVTDSVQWDLVDGFQEIVYEKFGIPKYFKRLLDIYEAGYLVCGYQDEYPGGRICVH